ncbi:hypothetical protein [Natribacillus halophilus]|uniref:Uncharacterized protein n=1 Tax=Natribacillus halophilus TaxID=549003 RepID=A0A1G8KFR2_9BACI|nr:hypothetical protein [Natribacillus halophilus]SDI41710.1 hypothetical protein SAMN04488123_10251 [Natribacillus halophilus]
MEFITKEHLFHKWEEKQVLKLSDLVQAIEEEFNVAVQLEGDDVGELDVHALANDPDVTRQIRMSREDREKGRIYSGEDGLHFLRQEIEEFECESDV